MSAAARLFVSWTNNDESSGGPVQLHYTLRAPDTNPPRIQGGNVTNGAKNVEPGPLNADKIQIIFDERVTGSIELRDENNHRIDWQGTVSGKTAELFPIAGHELRLATTYRILINVADADGNKAEFIIQFTTRAEE